MSHTATPREIQRWDKSQIRQHQLLVASVLLLVLTGMPLKFANHGSARGVASALGGADALAIGHRVGAIGLIVFLLWHFAYLLGRVKRRTFRPSTLPRVKDVTDAWHLALYLVGIRADEPKYDRYSFLEKFDYWAAVGGSCLMIVTGFALWLKDWANSLVGAQLWELAFSLHSNESVLAALFLLIGHVYHVHLAGGILPFNMVWLTGKMTEAEFKELHGAEWDRMQAAAGTAQAAAATAQAAAAPAADSGKDAHDEA